MSTQTTQRTCSRCGIAATRLRAGFCGDCAAILAGGPLPVPTLVLRAGALDADAKRYGSLTGLARASGLAPSTLARCVRGELTPGPTVIAGLLDATGKTFEQLFAVSSAD